MQTLSKNQFAGQILRNYRIERFLGQGRLNAIYLARNLAAQRLDALTLYIVPKRFSPEALTRFVLRFRKEAAAISSLDHAHILPVYEYGELAGNPYLVTPYVMHGSLTGLLKQRGKYDHSAILPILERLVSALEYAHSKGFIHGTLRPSTIVLSSDNVIQVAGFGLMHMLQLGGIEPGEQLNIPYVHLLSIAETFLVAPEYVAPEVVQGCSIDVRSDIYGLGCILFELLSGHPPFTGKDPLDIISKHVTEAIPSLHVLNPEVPMALVSVVNQALERNPARRFQHVLELAEAFKQASRGIMSCATSSVSSELTAIKQQDLLEDPSRDGYSSNKWQLVPPIVTGKHRAVHLSEQSAAINIQSQVANTDSWPAVPPVVTGQFPAVTNGRFPSVAPSAIQGRYTSYTAEQGAVSDLSTISPVPPPEVASPIKQENPASVAPGSQSGKIKPIPGSGQGTSSPIEAYPWWSQPEVASPLGQQTGQRQLARSEAPHQSSRLTGFDAINWADDPSIPFSLSASFTPNNKIASRKVSRRRTVAVLAASGLAVAVGAVALNLDKLQSLLGIAPSQTQTQPNGDQQMAGADGTLQPRSYKGAVIGNTAIALNSAEDFENPADARDSLLIHLPDNRFVAYEKTCTHEEIRVYYDPMTKQLICPAHGAIFDPANGGAVVQGPATRPLPSVSIHINSDGTITT